MASGWMVSLVSAHLAQMVFPIAVAAGLTVCWPFYPSDSGWGGFAMSLGATVCAGVWACWGGWWGRLLPLAPVSTAHRLCQLGCWQTRGRSLPWLLYLNELDGLFEGHFLVSVSQEVHLDLWVRNPPAEDVCQYGLRVGDLYITTWACLNILTYSSLSLQSGHERPDGLVPILLHVM